MIKKAESLDAGSTVDASQWRENQLRLLRDRLADLIEEYEAIIRQMSVALSEFDGCLRRQVK